jgi:hypothetical protein
VFENKKYVLNWVKPDNGGSAITGYKIHIMKPDGNRFTSEVSDCDHKTNTPDTQCSVVVSSLYSAPFDLQRGDEFNVIVSAVNVYGDSVFSTPSDPHAVVTVPDAPKNLKNNLSITNDDRIGITFENADSNGGLAITSYKV